MEQYCRTAGINEVGADAVFNSKPDPTVIFPAAKTTDLEPHAGAVTTVVFSPFHRKAGWEAGKGSRVEGEGAEWHDLIQR